MIYFSLGNSLQLQYDGLLTKLRGNFVSKEVYLLKGNVLTALGRPFSVSVSLKDGEVSEARAFEEWNGIEDIMNGDLPDIVEGTLMGELMRYLLMRLRRVLKIEPYANEHMLSVLREKLNDKFKYYDVSLMSSDILVSDMKVKGSSGTAEKVLKIISETSETEEALKDVDLPYIARLMGLCRYEEAASLYEDALQLVDADTIIGTELTMELAECYYFMDCFDDSVSSYLKCDRRYIKDLDDYKLRLGHAMLAGKDEGVSDARFKTNLICVYYKGILNPTYIKYNNVVYEEAAEYAETVYKEYQGLCIKEAEAAIDGQRKVQTSSKSKAKKKFKKIKKKG